MYCGKCGKRLPEGQTVCPDCIALSNSNAEYGSGHSSGNESVNDNAAHKTLNGIVLSEDEFAVRTYRCSELKFPKCTGYLSVTNHRVLFHGYSGGENNSAGSRIVDEVPLDSVSGISTMYGGKLLIGRLIAGLLLVIGAFVVFSNNKDSYYRDASPVLTAIGVFGLIIGAIILVTCYRKTFVLKIYSSKANNSPIDIGSGAGGVIGNSALFTVVAFPTDQTDKMMLELGAMINDLQNMGDYGVGRWKI